MSASATSPRPEKSTNVRTSLLLGAVRLGLRVGGLVPSLQSRVAMRLFTAPRRHARPDREDLILSEARPFALDVDGRRLAAWRWGDGPAVLLVHGWEGRGAQLGALVRPLVDRGFAVVAFDASAHGDSPGERLLLTDMARTIAATTEAILDGRAGSERRVHAIIAHSFGAAAVTLALGRRMLSAQAERARIVFLAPTLVTGATERFARLVGLSAVARRRFEARIEAVAGLSVADVDGEQLAPGITAPLLVIHDDRDDEVPLSEGERLACAWPEAQLRVTSGLGHNGVLWRPEAIEPAIAFVADAAPITAVAARRAFLDGWVEAILPERLARRSR
jgi:pimeloyl-ACP methyl ester carboxylesterase